MRSLLIFLLCSSIGLSVTYAGAAATPDESSSIYITCPSDTTVDCDAEIWDLSGYGSPQVVSSYPYTIHGPTETHHLSGCNSGYIKRSWVIYDHYWNPHYCHQHIHVGGSGGHLNIDWPEDYWIDQCGAPTDPDDLPSGFDRPVVTGAGDCSNIAIGHDDQVFTISGQACKKIFRTWTVVDWCIYHPRDNPHQGIWEYVQLIKVIGTGDLSISCPPDMTVSLEGDCNGVYVDIPPATGEADCYPDLHFSNNSPFADAGGADASGTYPPGEYWIKFTVTDGCGSEEFCKMKLIVRDEKKPIVYCNHGIATTIAEHGPNDYYRKLWPDPFDEGSYDNCTAQEDLKISIMPDMFTCAELGRNKVWFSVEDESGNVQTCETYVLIQDNMGFCPDSIVLDISGSLTDMQGNPLPDHTIRINYDRRVYAEANEEGNYRFTNLIRGETYRVRPWSHDRILDGVSVVDLMMMLQHIYQIRELDHPQQLIAMDVDKNEVINIYDAYALRNVITGFSDEFPNNAAWRFFDDRIDWSEVDALDTELADRYIIDTFRTEMRHLDFVGVKIGDVNGSSSLQDPTIDTRSGDKYAIQIEEGEDSRVMKFDKNLPLMTMEFTVFSDGPALEIDDAQMEGYTILEESAGIYRVLWISPGLRPRVPEDIHWATARLDLAYQYPHEVYESDELRLVELRRDIEKEVVGWNIYPNPAQGEVRIDIMSEHLNEVAELYVMDATGRVMSHQNIQIEQGRAYLQMDVSDLVPGTYIYKLTTPDIQSVKKLNITN